MSRNWLDKFLVDKATPIARTIRASYVEHLARLMEGKSNKFSSIDEALNDFASRLGLSNLEMESLKKEAMQKSAQLTDLKKLEDEGITDPKAIRYMSKSRGKHTDKTDSPFVLNTEKGQYLEKQLIEKKKKLQDSGIQSEDSQKNEFSGVQNSASSNIERLERLASQAEKFKELLDKSKSEQSPKQESLESRSRTIDMLLGRNPKPYYPGRGTHNALTDSEIQQVHELIQQGRSLREVAKTFGCSYSQIFSLTKDIIPEDKRKPQRKWLTSEEKETIKALLEEGISIADVARYFDRSPTNFYQSVQRMRNKSAEFGKILPFQEPSKEAIEDLKSELGEIDVDTPYKASRFGFNFTDLHGRFPQPKKPIKVTAYEYSFLKDNLVKVINEDLKKHLEQEMSFDDWIKFLEQQIQSREVPHTEGWSLIDKLEKMKRQLYGDEKTRPFVIDESGKRVSQQIKKIMAYFPVSYRKMILEMLAQGKYRHLLSEASGREHSGIFPTSYRRASFILMDSFAPFKAIAIQGPKDRKDELTRSIYQSGKNRFTNEEFKTLLDQFGVSYKEVPSTKEIEPIKLHAKVLIGVETAKNSDYKPLTYDKEAISTSDKESLLAGMHDKLFSAISQDLPLVYGPKSDGSFAPLTLKELGESKADYTTDKLSQEVDGKKETIPNPKFGLHPSFEGQLEQARTSRVKELEQMDDKAKLAPKAPKVELPERSLTPEEKYRQEVLQILQNMNKNKASSSQIIQKYAEAGLWMDDQGRSYSTEAQMLATLQSEMVEEGMNEVVDKAVSLAMQEIRAPEILPSQNKQEKKEKEEELQELPLAAHTIVRLYKLAQTNPKIQTILMQLIRR